MAAPQAKRREKPPAGPKAPPVIRLLAGTLEGFGDAAIVTEDQWQAGGVQIITANSKFAELTGYKRADLKGRNTRLLHGARTDLLAPRVAARRRLTTGEDWLYRKDGSEFYGTWSFSPIFYKGKPSGTLLGFYRDITEGRRLREALKQSQKLDTVGLLASGVAHDFNNLLSVINGYCEIMTAKIAGVPAAQKDLQEIHRAGLKASAISRQILEFSRRQETEVKVINFNTLIREITEILRRVVGDQTEVELRLDSDLGNVRMDPTQFQQVVMNFCFNARDAMPAGGKLSIRTYNQVVAPAAARRAKDLRSGSYAVLRVTDSGLGMSPTVQNNIFEPFFTTKPQGTGLGLATVLGIIRQHAGHITVESEPGRGTTFEIFVPETPESEQTTVTKLGALPAVRGTEALLIVEEDAVLRKMIAGILVTDGYTVTDAATPTEAAHLVKTAGLRPQLVLTQNCTQDGAALVRQLHAARPGLRLICTSTPPLPESLHEVVASATIHLPKPFALSTLLQAVRTLLDAKSAGRA